MAPTDFLTGGGDELDEPLPEDVDNLATLAKLDNQVSVWARARPRACPSPTPQLCAPRLLRDNPAAVQRAHTPLHSPSPAPILQSHAPRGVPP